jgi:hypothetical protein
MAEHSSLGFSVYMGKMLALEDLILQALEVTLQDREVLTLGNAMGIVKNASVPNELNRLTADLFSLYHPNPTSGPPVPYVTPNPSSEHPTVAAPMASMLCPCGDRADIDAAAMPISKVFASRSLHCQLGNHPGPQEGEVIVADRAVANKCSQRNWVMRVAFVSLELPNLHLPPGRPSQPLI